LSPYAPSPIPVNDRHLWSPQNGQKPTAFSMNLFISYFQELPLFALALENLCLMFSPPFRVFSIVLPPVSSRFHYSVCAYPSVILPSCNGPSCQRNSKDICLQFSVHARNHISIVYDHDTQVLSESNSRNATTSLAVFSPLSSIIKSSSARSPSSSSISVACDSPIPSPLLRPLATLAMTSP